MIEQIPGLPGNVVGFRATGTVTAADYESVIMPAVEALFAREKSVRFLYHLGPEFAGFEAGAVWDDAKLGLKHLSGWDRVAVVTDVDWVRHAMRLFAVVIPGHVRVYSNAEYFDAEKWLAG
ncbi:MAG: STAS/SEC14 domain-containing protein [Betaproteobacteria bacterium]|nr:STAS/SEC14 domain-containing protein [Betaproteobacteria bacterium]